MLIHKYLHEYNFPYHDFLLSNIDFFHQHYAEGIKESNSQGSYNVTFAHNFIWDFLTKKLLKIVSKNYYVDNYFKHHSLGIYIQDNKNSAPFLHNHMNSSIISGVFYINPPQEKEGGGLQLYINGINNPITLQPQPNKLYLFPSWIMHQPLPQTTSTPRICLNWGYQSRSRPIHKITGDLW